ncbi:Phosphatidylinositol 3,4,5-trisphosphate 3-phosphatase and dual-specificity phosphatase PTEN [Paramuricea clavata]|uniref:Phosphatidylinositol 3,4,5-trisphosphate 3-phosphatase and dual-specificity protein phosphatase PTEN n=1 Tax=Paramuricea clavata TaxID=317549 RepID=A0A7D9DN72_PARCT|nr:Phosphatidylinositol 3,4,5-trisphosphate 3-phosphatase and dual-specificity phosphatase PTEN [Paramuricea clavata]
MEAYLKKLVSKKKRRFYEDGFDLDLSYIKPNIVAMGFPSERIEGVYRNHIEEILRFLETKHKDHYKVYNLCSEREYDPAKFNHRVAKYPFDDHNAPPFQLMQPYCEDMATFLSDRENVAIVHCKAGKGRTGVMICAYLLHQNIFDTCKEALEYYGEARTRNKKGVTIPSQRRYVYYYAHFLKHSLTYTPTTLLITRFVMETVPSVNNGTCAPFFYVWQSKVKIYSSKSQESATKDAKNICFNLPQPLPVCGDIKVQFYNKDSRFGKKDLMFQFWFNTFFVSGLTPPPSEAEPTMMTQNFKDQDDEVGATSWFELHKEDLDKANKDKKNKIYSPNFKLQVVFTVPELKRNHMDGSDDYVDIECEGGTWKDNNDAHLRLPAPGTPTETFQRRKNRSRSPSRHKDVNNMKHSASNASIDSALGRNDIEDLSDSESESEWQENNKGKQV